MSQFIQLHILTTYPAANLNRDDTGRPKTLRFGGALRLRISSQSLKRAFRTSDIFRHHLPSAIGTRSTGFMRELTGKLASTGMSDEAIEKQAERIIVSEKLGKPKKEDKSRTEQLVHLGPDELERILEMGDRFSLNAAHDPLQISVLQSPPRAADIAMFGRMMADNQQHSVEAAIQVAHAFTVHRVTIEDDFFTAVDDLNTENGGNRGAGFLGVSQYGAGTFYLYICICVDLLLANLSGDRQLAKSAVSAAIEAATQVSPSGKQNSYASRAEASYVLMETGQGMPRSLAGAFQVPVGLTGEHDYLEAAIDRLTRLRAGFVRAYGETFQSYTLNVMDPRTQTLSELVGTAKAVIDTVKS